MACLESLNNPEINYAFLDGTFKIKPKYMNQVWILRAFIGDSTIALTYAYFLLESKLAESYTLALSIIKTAAPLFNPPNFMVELTLSLENIEQSETATLMPLSMVVCFTGNRQSSDIFQLYYPPMPLVLFSDQTSELC